ncbi:MAG: hypothetical protein H0V09_10800, partial [Gemmatimonadetes bacterium]|nr:hypothetical protein [Gemmatimonadota bacterium]
MTRPRLKMLALVCLAAGTVPAAARAQAGVQGTTLHSAILWDSYLGYPELLLRQPTAYDLLASASSPRLARMEAYRQFETALQRRTFGIVGSGESSEERRRAKRQLLSSLGSRLRGFPGAGVVR